MFKYHYDITVLLLHITLYTTSKPVAIIDPISVCVGVKLSVYV